MQSRDFLELKVIADRKVNKIKIVLFLMLASSTSIAETEKRSESPQASCVEAINPGPQVISFSSHPVSLESRNFREFSELMKAKFSRSPVQKVNRIAQAFKEDPSLVSKAISWLNFAKKKLKMATADQKADSRFSLSREISRQDAADVYSAIVLFCRRNQDLELSWQFYESVLFEEYVSLYRAMTLAELELDTHSEIGLGSQISGPMAANLFRLDLAMLEANPKRVVLLLHKFHAKDVLTGANSDANATRAAIFNGELEFGALSNYVWDLLATATSPLNRTSNIPKLSSAESADGLKALLLAEKELFPVESRSIAAKTRKAFRGIFYFFGAVTFDGVLYDRTAYQWVNSLRRYLDVPEIFAIPIVREATDQEKEKGKP